MPPRLNIFSVTKAVSALRQPAVPSVASRSIALPLRFRAEQSIPAQKRWNSSKKEPNPDEQVYPTQDQLPHVSEEAAEVDRIMNKEKSCDGQLSQPELDQGTPVEEVSNITENPPIAYSWADMNNCDEQVLQRDEKAMKHMPKIMQQQLKKSNGTRSFSTSARSRQPDLENSLHADASAALLADMIQQVSSQAIERNPGLKFDAPEIPSKTMNFRKRYDSLQEQFTKMLMQDGKLARAQNVCRVLPCSFLVPNILD